MIGLVSAFVVLEAILRVIKPWPAGIAHTPCVYVTDDDLGYRYEPNSTGWMHRNFEMDNHVRINSAGYRDIEWNEAQPGDYRILAVGDSFTAALHVGLPDTWTQVAQGELRARGFRSANVVNLGLDGTGTDIHLAVLKKNLERFQAQVVLLSFCQNDIADVARGKLYRECYRQYVLTYQTQQQRKLLKSFVDEHPRGRGLAFWLFDHLYTFRVVTCCLQGPENLFRRNMIGPPHLDLAWEKSPVSATREYYDRVLQEYVALGEQRDFKLMIIPLPLKQGETASRNALRNAVSQEVWDQLPLVDVMPLIHRRLKEDDKPYAEMFWRYDGHFSAYGNSVYGRAVAELVDAYMKSRPEQTHANH